MAMTGIQAIMTLEGITGNAIGSGQVPYPSAVPIWLRAMKENILFMARKIEDSFVLDINTDVDDSEDTIQAAATYLLGALARSYDADPNVVQFWDVATPTPGTTATGHQGAIYLPAGSTTAPAVGGVVWFPYEYFGTTCLVSSTTAADYATGPGTSEVLVYSIRRDE